jgi:6-phosphogluconate dehydrogenase
MKLAMLGLGKMGGNMTRRLLKGGIEVVGFDFSEDTVNRIAQESGMIPAKSAAEAVKKLGDGQKIVWLMLPSGDPTEQQIQDLIAEQRRHHRRWRQFQL